MRTLAATALLAYAAADETSLMQARVEGRPRVDGGQPPGGGSCQGSGCHGRQESTTKLLQTAVSMIKNGVTPDVITFVDSTNQEINEEVLAAIQREHDTDQAYINSLCQDFLTAVETLESKAADIAVHDDNRLEASEAHQNCRKQEAFACAHSRRCEEQLRQKWITVKHEETIMREIHGHIHDEWCIHPPFFAEIDVWLTNPFNWADMSPYPILDLPQDVRDFRQVSVTHFNDYMAQKIVVEEAWRLYNEKLVECSGLEEVLEAQTPICDQAQITLREHACQHAVHNREAREEFGQEWDRINRLYDEAVIAKSANEQDRKNEWETLKIVQCLLDHVHSTVVDSIETGAPCPTIDSDPDGVTLAIEDCHIVTRGCEEGSMTAHLCLTWCEKPSVPPLPPVEEPACTPAYIAREQGSFLASIQADYNAMLNAPDATYPNDALADYNTILSPAGWAGCAAPLVCVDCAGLATVLPVPTYENTPHTCHLHEEYLSPGQSNFDSFRCLDGTCISMAGRCNGHMNCADESDETGCDADAETFVPAYLAVSSECPADMNSDVHFQCANSRCIEKIGLCNGHDNCGDNSDEAHCNGAIHVTTEATSGHTITVETLQSHTGVFHDREYNFDSLGHFTGKTFIKYSNNDKATDHDHVMTKIRSVEPLTVYIVKLEGHSLPWLAGEGYEPAAYSGVVFSGVRETRHKEWDPTLLTTDTLTASEVYSKTFAAGTITIPGNNGGDGSFLIFVDRPSAMDDLSHLMVQGCNNNPRDLEPSNTASLRCCSIDGSSCQTGAHARQFTFLDGQVSTGEVCEAGACQHIEDTWCHRDLTHLQASQLCAANGERLCTRAEVESDLCCGTGCSHDGQLIWITETASNPLLAGYQPANVGACRTADGDGGSGMYSRADHVENVAQCASACDASSDCRAFEFTGVTSGQPTGCELHRQPMPVGTGHPNGLCYNKVEDHMCCRALTAECLACAAMVSVGEYCAANPDIQGCVSIPTLPPALWTRHTQERASCGRLGSVKFEVHSQMECQQAAVHEGHQFYTYMELSHVQECATHGECTVQSQSMPYHIYSSR